MQKELFAWWESVADFLIPQRETHSFVVEGLGRCCLNPVVAANAAGRQYMPPDVVWYAARKRAEQPLASRSWLGLIP